MLIISRDVADEVERNLSRKAPNAVRVYRSFLEVIGLRNVNPPQALTDAVAQYVVAKDAPIGAAAISSQVDYLVTYDRKHLLDLPEVAQKSKLKIVTPDVVLLEIENDSEIEDG